MSDLAFVVALACSQVGFVALDLLDRFLPAHEARPPGRTTLSTLLFMGAVLAVFFAVQFGLMALAPRPDRQVAMVASWWTAAPSPGASTSAGLVALSAVLGLYLGGLVDYLVHRFVSHSKALFFTHEYHHLPREVFLLMPGLAARPFAVVSTLPVTMASAVTCATVLVWGGASPTALDPMKLVLLAHVWLLLISHCSFLRRWWWPHHLMKRLGLTTPQEHLLHHTIDLEGNFANLTTVWDRVFGTYLDPLRPEYQGHELGLPYDQDWLGTLTMGHWKLSREWRDRFDVGRWCRLG